MTTLPPPIDPLVPLDPDVDRSGDAPPRRSLPDVPTPSSQRASVAGAVAAATALGVGELVAGIGGAVAGTPQSLVASVGAEFVDRAPGGVVRPAIEAFGTADKAVLLAMIVVVCLGLGAWLGRVARTRPDRAAWGFVAFGVVGILLGLRDPLASAGVTIVAAVAATAAGVFTLRALLTTGRRGSPLPAATPAAAPAGPTEWPTDPASSRRGFIGWTAAAAAFAAGAGAAGVVLGRSNGVEAARNDLVLPKPVAPKVSVPAGITDVDGLSPYITPNKAFYRIDTALIVPQVDPANWKLEIDGMVDSPYTLSFDELLAMPMVEETITMACVSNGIGGDLVGNAVWQGVPLTEILDRAGVQDGATQLVGTSVDGWTCGLPTELLYDGRPALLVVGMNGEPLPIRHGFPARVVVAGLYGYVSATKWVSKLTLTRWEDFDGYWIPKGWSKEGPVKTSTRIDVPKRGRELPAGITPIAGVSWAPNRGISKVEVQIDDGEWTEARLGDAVADATWVQWMLDWDATPGVHTIMARATDGNGDTQTSVIANAAPDGATGWASRLVEVV